MRRLMIACLTCTLAFALGVGLTGCGSTAKAEVQTTSKGKQLEELQDAYDKGLMTDQEYEKERRRIMDSK